MIAVAFVRYVEEHVQKTAVAIETQGFALVTSGKRRESLTVSPFMAHLFREQSCRFFHLFRAMQHSTSFHSSENFNRLKVCIDYGRRLFCKSVHVNVLSRQGQGVGK